MKVEVAVLSSPFLVSLMVSVDVKHRERRRLSSELRNCVKVEVAVLGFPILLRLMVSMDVKQH